MFALVKNNLIYIKCAKNGCSTFGTLLSRHGWQEINLFENNLDLSKYLLWAHITEPTQRHTRGVHQYLKSNPDIDINNPIIEKLLVSGVFDEHTYSLSMMLGPIWYLPIYWIPLDAQITVWNTYPKKILVGDDLTNHFFQEQGLDIQVTKKDHLNVGKNSKEIRDKINNLKIKHVSQWNKISKNFLELDIIKYCQTVDFFQNKYNKSS